MAESVLSRPGAVAAIDCADVDIQQIEEVGVQVADAVQSMVMNVDITSLQFDAHSLYEQAQRLGLDAGELEDYGFEKKGKCSNVACIDRRKIKDMATYLDNMGRF